ncbi:hypothetical protein CFN03_04875 [Salinicoccus roseus]|uniref:Uncharacterized protein n=1 Tax=Salinicoccus roseus TaxID=45670 RepID=A0A265EAV9_9STAP|nr:hypothetical protein CFN03_04875 [Salinicoccus roseus]
MYQIIHLPTPQRKNKIIGDEQEPSRFPIMLLHGKPHLKDGYQLKVAPIRLDCLFPKTLDCRGEE